MDPHFRCQLTRLPGTGDPCTVEHATHEHGGPDGSVLVVHLPPDLNHETVEPLRALVARYLPNRDGAGVVLDLGQVRLITSIGVAALLQIDEFCRDRGASLVLAAASSVQQGFLRMLKLERKFIQAATVEDAIRQAARA